MEDEVVDEEQDDNLDLQKLAKEHQEDTLEVIIPLEEQSEGWHSPPSR